MRWSILPRKRPHHRRMTDPPLLRGEDVTLLPVPAGADLDALDRLTGGRPVGRGWPHADTAAGLAFAAAGAWSWLIVDGDGCIVGECGTKTAPQDGAVEIGYGLASPSRGAGLGARAVATLVSWLAARPDVETVIAHVAVDNLASARLLERLGFTARGEAVGELEYVRKVGGERSP
jgi:RimJ/RimL family protein N-acetyltransferase